MAPKYSLTFFILLGALASSLFGSEFLETKYAKNFTLEYHPTHKIATVTNAWRGSGDAVFTYALVPKSASELPELPKEAIVIRTPVDRMVTMATTYVGQIQDLDLYDELVGAGSVAYINDPKVHQRIKAGKTTEVQKGSSINIEKMILLRPDAIFTSSTGNPQFDVHPQLLRARLPSVITAGYMEPSPLARTEWVKFLAAFFDREEDAVRIFDSVEQKYNELVQLAANAKNRPVIFANAPYGGKWHAPGGKSYMAQTFKDAGADYLWADDDSSGGIPLDFERIYYKAAKADFWIHQSSHRSLASLIKSDERFIKFDAVKNGNVFNNTKRMSDTGGNDVWEKGMSHPELVLADLIAIFHPDLMPEHEFFFYEKIR